MKKTENPKIKEFLIMFSSETLEQCTLFTQTFGNGFARMRLEQNVQKVFTNEYSTTVKGYQDSFNKSITLCTPNIDDDFLTVEKIQKYKEQLFTALHEAIHAILSRDKDECKKFNIISGTGIMGVIVNQQGEMIEVGRGLNEGLTNWICECTGYSSNTYPELTIFLHQLELAIGPERVMAMGKGNIRKNVAKQLDMSEAECISFLMKVDQVYQVQSKITSLSKWKAILEIYLIFDKLSDEEKRIASYEYRQLQADWDYIEIICGDEYKKYLQDKSFPDCTKARIAYLGELINMNQNELPNLIANVEGEIFDKYFKKSWEEILKSGIECLDSDAILKLKTLKQFFKESRHAMGFKLSSVPNSLTQFLTQFAKVEEKYFEQIRQLVENDFKKEQLTLERAKQLFSYVSKMGDEEIFYLTVEIAQLMSPKDILSVQPLLFKLQQENRLEDIKEYIIYRANIENRSIYLFFRNGQLEFTSEDTSLKTVNAKDEVKDFNDAFEFTTGLDEEEQEIIREFAQIKKEAEHKNPNANIMICGRTIVVDLGNAMNVYYIDKKIISLEKLEKENSIKVEFQNAKNNTLPVPSSKTSIINRAIDKIKQLFLGHNSRRKEGQTGDEKDYPKVDEAREFRKKYLSNVKDNNVSNSRLVDSHKNKESRRRQGNSR